MKIFILALMFCFTNMVNAQETEKKISVTLGEGVIVAGYVNDGAYINFTGPSVKIINKPYIIWFGVLPSLRIKEDVVVGNATKNSIITPALGVGITFAYKHVAIQVPAYYNSKTGNADGKWNLGIGIGYKF